MNIDKIFRYTGILFSNSEVYLTPGVVRHIKKRHEGIWEKYKSEITYNN